jgi:hypothetical protein
MPPLFAVVVAATPYFFTQDAALYRAVVEPIAAVQSGASPALERSRARVELPGAVIAFTQRAEEAVAVACAQLVRSDALPGCDVFHVDATGAVRALGLRGYSAELMVGNREVLVWADDLRLVRLALASGTVQTVATSVLEPRLFADGSGFSFSRAPGLKRLTPGFNACPFTQSFGDEARKLDGPCDAQAPFVSPTGTALYVSTATGMASLVSAGRRVESARFLPVPGRELVWLDGERALYTAHYQTQELWLFDARTRTARRIAGGREPALIGNMVFAFDGERVVQVEVGR